MRGNKHYNPSRGKIYRIITHRKELNRALWSVTYWRKRVTKHTREITEHTLATAKGRAEINEKFTKGSPIHALRKSHRKLRHVKWDTFEKFQENLEQIAEAMASENNTNAKSCFKNQTKISGKQRL